ncbi:hypothetical protein EDC04DRAFT_2901972 [Pisolithus marmoratus]|nr:hypothetical protein EDC04DRAFT_2901972 [Pisolithus marmoratus]
MTKRHLETADDAQQYVWHRKCTHSPDIDIPMHEPDLPETDHGLLDDEEVPPTPDLSGPVNKDAFPFIQDHSDADIDTQLNENFSLYVHDAPDAEIDTQLNENFSPHIHDAPNAEIDTQLNENFSLHIHDAPDAVQHPPDDEQTPISILEQANLLHIPTIWHQCRTHPVIDIEALAATATLPSMKQTMCFIRSIKHASLDDQVSKLSEEYLERL